MVKPIDVNEMVWRVEALLRRSQLVNQRKTKFGETEFDCDTLTISSHGETTELPQKEFYLLYKLITSPNRIFTRRQIIAEEYSEATELTEGMLNACVELIKVHADGSLEITFNYMQEFKELLETTERLKKEVA